MIPVCECCGEPASRQDRDGVWLCEADWCELIERWSELSEDEREGLA